MSCGSKDRNGNRTHYCEYPYTRDAPTSDPYSIRREKLGGIASDDQVVAQRAKLIKLVCYLCSYYKNLIKEKYEYSARYPDLYLNLYNELDSNMKSLFDYIDNLQDDIVMERDDNSWFNFFTKTIKNNMLRFLKFNYPNLNNTYLLGGRRRAKRHSKRHSRRHSRR